MANDSFIDRIGLQASLMAAYMIFTGLVTTEAYYEVFGLRFQTLQFPPTHVVYRGLTILSSSPSLFVPLALFFGWLLVADDRVPARPRASRRKWLALALSV